MHVYATIDDPRMPLGDVPAHARRAEALGFHGLLIPEAVHDGFLTALLALEHRGTYEQCPYAFRHPLFEPPQDQAHRPGRFESAA